MSQSPFHDDRAIRLLSRVGDDISQLRQDIRSLFSHTARRTIPDGAREIAIPPASNSPQVVRMPHPAFAP